MATLTELCAGLPLDPLPPLRPRDASLPHAPVRTPQLTGDEKKVCLATTNELENDIVLYHLIFRSRLESCSTHIFVVPGCTVPVYLVLGLFHIHNNL